MSTEGFGLTDSQIAQIRRGDRFADREGVFWTATSDARLEQPPTSNGTHQAWLVTASGSQSTRLTFRNAAGFRPALRRVK